MTITGRRPTLTDCGCEATVYADGSGIELHYCPMHQAAKQLLEALKVLREHCDYPDPAGARLADAAIAAAEG